MNEEIQKWFTEHGKVVEAITIEDKTSIVPGASLIQYTFEDGSKLSVRPAKYGPDGAQTAPQDIVSRELPKPPSASQVPGNATPRIEGTPTGQDANGQPTFDNSKPIMVFRTPDGKQVDARPLQVGEREQWDREQAGLPSAVASQAAANKAATDKAAAAAQPASATAAVPGYPGWTATTTKTPATPTTPEREVTTYTGPDGKPQPSLPAKPDAPAAPDIKVVTGSDGKPYTITTTLGPNNVPRVVTADARGNPVGAIPGEAKSPYVQVTQDKDSGQWFGLKRDGSWEPMQGGPGAPQASTGPKQAPPSLPTIVVGQSQDALRTAYDGIQAEVDSGRRTAAWGENRRKEVFEAAQLAVSEAHLIEQSRQANQTTRFNVANAQMGYGQSSLENALKFTLSINDKLKPGSGTGGKMFAALFNMQMAMGIASGMYSTGVPRGSSVGAPGAPGQPAAAPGATSQPPAPRLTNPGDPAAVEADHQQSLARLAAGDVADAAAGPSGRAMTPAIGGPPQPLPERGGVPVTSTPALPGGPAVPPPPPAADVGAANVRGAAPPPVRDDWRTAPPTPDLPSTQPPGPSFVNPPAGQPGNIPTAPVGMAQPQGFAALDALRAQYQPAPAMPAIDPAGGMDPMTGGIGIPPALQRAQIAATPPWRLPPHELENLVNQFGEQDVFGWPGQSLLGMG